MRLVLAVALLFCESSGSSSELDAPSQLQTMAQSLQERAVGYVGRRADRERVPLQQCAGCRKPLIGDRVLLNGVGYHAACLKCHECGHPLGDQPFVVTENLRFHSSCFCCQHPGCGMTSYLHFAGVTPPSLFLPPSVRASVPPSIPPSVPPSLPLSLPPI